MSTKEGSIFIFIFSDSPNYDVNIAPRRKWKKCTGLYVPAAKPAVVRPAVVRPPRITWPTTWTLAVIQIGKKSFMYDTQHMYYE